MEPWDIFFKMVEVIGLIGVGVSAYTRLMTKIKQLEMEIQGLKEKLASAEKQDDRILNKLDAIADDISDIKVEMQNKQDRQ